MSIRILAVVLALTALVLSGCGSDLPWGGSSSAATAPPAAVAKAPTPAKASSTQRASKAALGALGAEVVETKEDFRLCSLVDEYRLCDGQPCQKGGLKATTYFVCRQTKCASREIPTPDSPSFASQPSCVSGCRKMEAQWRARHVPLETFYCVH